MNLKQNIKRIANFFKFLRRLFIKIFNYKDEIYSTDQEAERRLEICNKCDTKSTSSFLIFWNKPVCDVEKGGCGCNLLQKTKFEFESCPLEKW